MREKTELAQKFILSQEKWEKQSKSIHTAIEGYRKTMLGIYEDIYSSEEKKHSIQR